MDFTRLLRGHLSLARISNAPTVVGNVLAGAAVAGAVWHADLVPVSVAMVLYYTAGMYLNDICDVGYDRAERPNRPLPSGLIRMGTAVAVTVALFVAGTALLWTVSRPALLSGLVLVGLIVLYDTWHKGNPAAPVLMASTRALVYATAFLAFGRTIGGELAQVCAMALLYVIGLTAFARSETAPTITGRLPLAFLLLPSAWLAWKLPFGWWWILLAAFAGWVVHAASLVRRGNVGAGITRMIAGIALFDALVLAAYGFEGGAWAACGAFGLTLFLQRFVKGT